MFKLLFEQRNKVQFPRLLCPISFPFLSIITSVSSCFPEDLVMLTAPLSSAPAHHLPPVSHRLHALAGQH